MLTLIEFIELEVVCGVIEAVILQFTVTARR